MGIEERIEQGSRKRRDGIEGLGVVVYATRFDRANTVTDAIAAFEGKTGDQLEQAPVELKIAGRVVAVNRFGKAGSLRLSDGATRIQIFIRKDVVSELDFAVYKKLDIGDYVGV